MSIRGLPPDDRLATVDDAADRVGRDRRTLFRWIADGLLTPYKKRGDRRTHRNRGARHGVGEVEE